MKAKKQMFSSMKKFIFILAFMLMGVFAFASTTPVKLIKPEVINPVTSEKLVSYQIFDNLTISIPENALNSNGAYNDCGFTVYYDDGGSGAWGGSGSFWMTCDSSTTMQDIIDILLEMFF
jgi:hypothetical protein